MQRVRQSAGLAPGKSVPGDLDDRESERESEGLSPQAPCRLARPSQPRPGPTAPPRLPAGPALGPPRTFRGRALSRRGSGGGFIASTFKEEPSLRSTIDEILGISCGRRPPGHLAPGPRPQLG